MIEKIVIVSLIVMAIWATMWEDAIFDFVRKWGEKHIIGKYEKWQKPLYDCPICMVPYYGSIIYWVFLVDWHFTKVPYGTGIIKVPHTGSIVEWIVVIGAAMGLNAVFVKMFPDE